MTTRKVINWKGGLPDMPNLKRFKDLPDQTFFYFKDEYDTLCWKIDVCSVVFLGKSDSKGSVNIGVNTNDEVIPWRGKVTIQA